jgi:hypothetical protein
MRKIFKILPNLPNLPESILLSCFLSILVAFPVYSDSHEDDQGNDYSYVTLKTAEEDDDISYNFSTLKYLNLRPLGIMACSDVPLLFNKCITSVCSIDTSFGTIVAKIKEFKRGRCEYIERTSGLGGINCSFPANQLLDVDYLFNRRLQKISTKVEESVFSNEEVNKTKDLINSYCTYVKDYKLIKIVEIDRNTQYNEKDNVLDPELNFVDLKDIIKNQKELSKKYTFSQYNSYLHKESTLQDLKTLMFTSKEIKFLNKILQTIDSSSNEDSNITSYLKTGITVFYLDSIVFESVSKWAVWINGIKYDNSFFYDKEKGIKVEYISKNNATVKLTAPNIDRINPDWRGAFQQISDNKYESNTGGIILEFVKNGVNVYFTLKQNQSFNARTMQIIDGKVYN